MTKKPETFWNEGQQVGPWRLLEHLGGGGNGEVWVAARGDGKEAALKLLFPRFQDPASPRYQRFRDEAAAHRLLEGHPGVLPLVDCHLPETASADDPAWLATERATLIRAALDGTGLEGVVAAMASIAQTMASLHGREMAHRDLKPSNLYRYQNAWVIGDLGLVDFPGKEDITDTNEKLGPRHYIAPEMVSGAKSADFTRADVYSLAKTLWVLATGQTSPPPGEHRLDVPAVLVREYVTHPRAHFLDRLIERATRHDPADRPTMKGLAEELAAWLSPSLSPAGPGDLSEITGRIAATVAPARLAAERRRAELKAAQQALEFAVSGLLPIAERLQPTGASDGKVHVFDDQRNLLSPIRMLDDPEVVWKQGYSAVASHMPHPDSILSRVDLLCAVVFTLLSTGEVCLGAGHIINSAFGEQVIWSARRRCLVGSALQENAIAELLAGLTANLRPALEHFARWLGWDGTSPVPALPGSA